MYCAMAEPELGIDLDGSARLLRAVRYAEAEVGLARSRIRDLAALAAPVPARLGPLDAAHETLERHARLIAETRRRLLGQDVAPPQPWMMAPSGDPRSALDAHQAVGDALADLEQGDIVAAAESIRQWSNHPAFASSLIEELGAEGIVEICWLSYSRGGHDGGDHNEYDDLLIGLTTALQRSFASAGTLVDFEDLYRVARRRDQREFPLGTEEVSASLAMLFRYGMYYPPEFFVAATRALVVETNQLYLVTPIDQRASALPSVDLRHLVLRSASHNSRAAMAIVEEFDLDDLAHAWFDYQDDGEALGELLLKATRPDPDDIPATRMALARRVITMVAVGEIELARGVHDILGLLAAPYISSFRERGTRDDAFAIVPSALVLDNGVVTGFLDAAMGSTRAARDLQKASAAWAWLEFNRLAADPATPAAAYSEVANGVATVTGAWEQRRLDDAQRADTRAAVAAFALDLMTEAIPVPALDRIVSVSPRPATAVAADSMAGAGWDSLGGLVSDLVTGGAGDELELRRDQSRQHLEARAMTVLLAAHALRNQGRLDGLDDPPEHLDPNRSDGARRDISPDELDELIKVLDEHLVGRREPGVLAQVAAEISGELDEIDTVRD